MHVTLGQDWEMGQYSRYQDRVYTRKSAQVSTHASFTVRIVAAATTDFSLIQAWLPIQGKGSRDTSLCIVECSPIEWAWLQSLAVYDGLFLLKHGVKLTRLSFIMV